MPAVRPVPPFDVINVPAIVMVPEPVTGPPDVVSPVVPPETSTEVTVPLFVAAIVMEPDPLVTEMPVPAVKVALASVLPVELPIKSSPSIYDVCPVPPFVVATIPVTFEAVPETFPVNSAVILFALKLPEVSLYTIVETVFELVALLFTVNVMLDEVLAEKLA